MVGMVGLIKDLDHVNPMQAQQAGDLVYLLGQTGDDYAGSELQKMLQGDIDGVLNNFDLEASHQMMMNLLAAMQAGHVASAHDLSEGGLGVALSEALFDTDLGFELNLTHLTNAQLFSETPGRFIVTVSPDQQDAFEDDLGDDALLVGEVTNTHWLDTRTADGDMNVSVADLQTTWKEAIPCLLKSKD